MSRLFASLEVQGIHGHDVQSPLWGLPLGSGSACRAGYEPEPWSLRVCILLGSALTTTLWTGIWLAVRQLLG